MSIFISNLSNSMQESQYGKLDWYFKTAVLLAILVVALYLAGNVFFPIIFSAFIALSLKNIMNWFDRRGINRFVGAAALTISLCLLFLGTVMFLIFEGYYLVRELEGISGEQTLDSLEFLLHQIQEKFNLNQEEIESPLRSMAANVINASGQVFSVIFKGLQSTIVFFSLVPLYVFFMLAYRRRLSVFIDSNYDIHSARRINRMINDISVMLRKYLGGLFIVIGIVGTLNTIGLHFIGLKFALFLGFSTALLLLIPYIGVLIGSLIPATLALITMDSPWYALIILAMYGLIQVVEGNYITPAIIGGSLNLNPLVIIIGLILLGLIGGTFGLVLAVPIIATIKIALRHSKRYRHIALLFENE